MSSSVIVPACSVGEDIEKLFVEGDITLDDFSSEIGDNCDRKVKTKDRSKWYWRRLSDRIDSLLYYPHALAYLCNCGDMDGAAELIKRHFHKKALVHISGTVSMVLSMSMYISLLTITDILYCDSLSCIRSTHVEDNQIKSKVYYSYTDVASMYENIGPSIKDPLFKNAFAGTRKETLRHQLKVSSRPPELQAKLAHFIETDETLEIHGKVNVTITFDQRKLKIMKVENVHKILSVYHNGERYRFNGKKEAPKGEVNTLAVW